ncbi:MAG: Asp-tRNA(Asn)/Glu-tRNA(Gln) amidotransferase subunit GatC [Candidatus Nomurabacteria bacterium]|jgi:aspartyl-tRNA(Asn)/glutamyl-tRNA(Gln) amidotransferase subunit C|nr:Asp-tRNA(Asn)/Glu-tRNA(Gln) amidotransferase subunit GatC [Candidatus Nomurabacteria bacterium]
MKITEKEIRHLAELTGLSLTVDEQRGMAVDLEKIVEYIGELGELDTAGVDPTYQVTGLENVWREDTVGQHLSREELLELAPAVRGNSVEVHQVL